MTKGSRTKAGPGRWSLPQNVDAVVAKHLYIFHRIAGNTVDVHPEFGAGTSRLYLADAYQAAVAVVHLKERVAGQFGEDGVETQRIQRENSGEIAVGDEVLRLYDKGKYQFNRAMHIK